MSTLLGKGSLGEWHSLASINGFLEREAWIQGMHASCQKHARTSAGSSSSNHCVHEKVVHGHLKVMEDLKLVGHVRALFGILECVPGAILSDHVPIACEESAPLGMSVLVNMLPIGPEANLDPSNDLFSCDKSSPLRSLERVPLGLGRSMSGLAGIQPVLTNSPLSQIGISGTLMSPHSPGKTVLSKDTLETYIDVGQHHFQPSISQG